MRTLIAVPCMDQVSAHFAQSLAMLEKVGDCAIAFQVGSLIYNSRNDLAVQAVKMGADQVLWLDSDMLFTPDTMKRLIEAKKYGDIVSGLYFRRVAPYRPVLFDTLTIDDEGCKWTEPKEIPAEPFEVAGVGFGCVLTPTEVFLSVMEKHGYLFQPLKGVGEDLSFCWRARQCGYKIAVDPSIACGHVGHHIVTRDFYETYTKTRKGGSL